MKKTFTAPLDVPVSLRPTFIKNFKTLTHGTGRLMLFAGDQKIEHLNKDFYGEGIAPEDGSPEHLFKIAAHARIGCFATQLGLLAKYGADYKSVPYLVKLNSKTNLVKAAQRDPESLLFTPVSKVVEFKKQSKLKILAVGYTLYLGSEFEAQMLKEAATIIYEAHQASLIAVIWCYPRGKAVVDEKDPTIVAGAAGVAASLGADFVKVNAPKKDNVADPALLKIATKAAGRTRLVCAGGSSTAPEKFLKGLYEQIHIGGTSGNATGRNIHQKSLAEAVKFTNAIAAVTLDDMTAEAAVKKFLK
jgi:fructose-bisphosphate aldolase/6-deoxy-5-ketofructose 1-phosphate synthase